MESRIDSVLGPVDISDLQWIHPHEHLIGGMDIQSGVSVTGRPGCIEYIRRQMLNMLPDLRRYRVNGFLDALTIDIGRDDAFVDYAKGLSKATGMHIFLLTGFYLQSVWPDWIKKASSGQLAGFITEEFAQGIGKTGVRPTMIKLAIQHGISDPFDSEWGPGHLKVLDACALACHRTGAAIHIHSAAGSRKKTVEILRAADVPADRIYLAHVEMGASEDELVWLTEQGVRLIFTGWGYINQPELFRLIRKLVDDGHSNKILLSMDFMFSLMNEGRDIRIVLNDNADNASFSYLHTHVIPGFRNAGVSDEQLELIMHSNPVEMLIRR